MLKLPENPFHIHDKVLVAKQDDIMHGCIGKVVSHFPSNENSGEYFVKVKFDFKQGQYKPKPKNMAFQASNIQFRIFEVSHLIRDTKLNRLLYG